MPLHDKAFWVMSFFLVGTLVASATSGLSAGFKISIFVILLLALGLAVFGRYWLAGLALFGLIGVGYYFWYSGNQAAVKIPIGETITVTGLIQKVATVPEKQTLTVSIPEYHDGKISFTVPRYPDFRYGDQIKISGKLDELFPDARRYYQKEGVLATMRFPKITLLDRGQGNKIKQALFRVRDRVAASFSQTLPPEEATFLTGLTLGKSAGFPKEFSEKLKLTGTTHLVALSGFNVTIIGRAIALLFGLWFSRRLTFIISVIGIIAFVIMAGAEASVVRAAIMGIIALFAGRIGRPFSMRNAIAAAAVVMVIVNPFVLAFDVGFQLSFLALLGLVYLEPALRLALRVSSDPGFLSWRANLLTTTSAQLAVLPILLLNFGFFSPLSLITNALILVFVPVTMLFGFLIFVASLIASQLALFIALPGRLLLGYEVGVINLFSKFSFGITTTSLPIIVGAVYYAVLIGFVFFMRRKIPTVI